ncbi:fas apoptotic inhibitory molecule 1 [Anastrepha obliqua]|uniref:fas apoptotic inhibitory molecule 1 n=1 Tax=Anastrepha obliqua TaxID=95512 RepID=UPI002409736D|nr:fas apoptotic inhibitory molecule 1 [Anastrepha obliqua]XP_054740657.1 fas apoptotic inhibitory molecule 1 [Anastrepha obliqua]XP_054740658.1 fas apoptotic inhibitory molecule 1 [Anastrepha obliqua]XP_054740659.1 fas apoptotic inhibitory molecule 1 [Anastrepha obliqua]XP_054740660.1 fas apoptotic inhibitory molecule 1 [Anastrepha obliqua]
MSFLSPSLRLENLPNEPIMTLDHIPEEKRYNKNNIVAKWCAPINGKMYRIELEHGTTTGRRMIWVNGKEVLRRDWMFKLVGEDSFYIDQARCIIRVDPAPGFRYDYSLYIDGKPHEQYTDELTKHYRLWLVTVDDIDYRIMLELDTINLYVNDQLRGETGEFVDGGTDTKFNENGIDFVLQARSSGNKLDGLTHTLLANGEIVPEAKILEIMQERISILSPT